MEERESKAVTDQFNVIRDAIEAHSDQQVADSGELTDSAGQPIDEVSEEQDTKLKKKVAEALALAADSWCCIYLDFSNNQDLICLEFLRYCSDIKGLKLVNCQSLQTLRGIEHLVGLKDLVINDCVQLKDLWELKELSELLTLDVSGCAELTDNDLANIWFLEKVRHLKLNDLPGLSDIEHIYGFRALKSLEMLGCYYLESLEGIQGAFNLERLSINGAPLTDLGPLKELPKLFDLSLDDMPYLMSLDDLPSLRHLRYLTLSRLDDECDTSAIQKIRKCCQIRVI